MIKEKRKMISKIFDETFWKFMMVGTINTIFGTVIMFSFYNILHLSYWISSASNYIFASMLSYFLNKYFTFQNKEKVTNNIYKFAINIAICYFISYGIAKPCIRFLFLRTSVCIQDNISMLVGMGIFVILNYCGQRFLVFRK